MKKIIILLLVFLLCGCGNQSENTDNDSNTIETNKYIEPINEIEVFDYLNDDTKGLLYTANDDSDVKTYILSYLGKELIDVSTKDINGNTINFSDYKDSKLIIEVMASWCEHCKEQTKSYTSEIIKNHPEITFIEYFNEGDVDEIKAFYKEIGEDIPNNLIIIPHDDNVSTLILANYSPKYYPGFLFFNNGILTWCRIADLKEESLDKVYDIAFNDGLDLNDLVDEKGTSVLSYAHLKEDVIDSISDENKERLSSIDNDDYTTDLTYNFIGKTFDYSDQYDDDSTFSQEVSSEEFLNYEDEDTVIFYIYGYSSEQIQMLNDLYNAHSEVKMICVNASDEDNEKIADELNMPLVSIMNAVPRALNDLTCSNYPTALFIEKGTITGVYSNVNITGFNDALGIFFGDNSIALVKNN